MSEKPQDAATPAESPYKFIRDENGRFLPGTRGPLAPTKGKLGGRALALRTLDRVMAQERNQENLANALQAEFENDPVRFFKTIIMPLLPQDVKVRLSEEGGFRWMTLPDMIRTQGSASSTLPAIDVSESSAADDAGAKP